MRDGSDHLDRSGLSLPDLSRALLVIKTMLGDKPFSVRTASETFNTTPHLIQGTVRDFGAGGLYLAGPSDNPGTQYIEIAAGAPPQA